ncbi:hypothetical protein [Sphaerotilus sp.]|uniref:hypothetical protein n=1 Tax=Sphaerotilus sp. TaxID=2093942 RepID=UPI003A10366C
MRGGSWINSADNLRCAYRNRNHPDNRNNNLGFCVVLRCSHVLQPLLLAVSALATRWRIGHPHRRRSGNAG